MQFSVCSKRAPANYQLSLNFGKRLTPHAQMNDQYSYRIDTRLRNKYCRHYLPNTNKTTKTYRNYIQ